MAVVGQADGHLGDDEGVEHVLERVGAGEHERLFQPGHFGPVDAGDPVPRLAIEAVGALRDQHEAPADLGLELLCEPRADEYAAIIRACEGLAVDDDAVEE